MNRETKIYTSFSGDKLLQHTDVLEKIQNEGHFQPIMVELCPTEVCQSDCPFCSVAGRPIKSYMSMKEIDMVLRSFKKLGAKSLEITGGGNPLLYRDKKGDCDINCVIALAHDLGYKIGIITNSHDLKVIKPDNFSAIDWIRVSLIQLDEGVHPEKYNFRGFPYERLSFSYTLYETGGKVDPLSRTGKVYEDTSSHSIQRIAELIDLHPGIKFVRIYGDCTSKGNHLKYQKKFQHIIDYYNHSGKMFFKEVDDDDGPFNDGCYIGMLRPYVAPAQTGDKYMVYPCNSFVLSTRGYDSDYAICSIDNIEKIWNHMNKEFKKKGFPYEIKQNGGFDWTDTCKFCYFSKSNELLHNIVISSLDPDFI